MTTFKTMMDTEVLFRDGRRFVSDFNDIPSLMTNDSVDSAGSDVADADTFSSEMCSWNYDTGLGNDLDLMLDHFEFDPLTGDDFHTIVRELEHTVEEAPNTAILDQKPLLPDLESLKKESHDNSRIVVKTEPNTSNVDSHCGIELKHIKKEIPGLDEVISVPFFEYSQFPNHSPEHFAVNDLPPNLDICSFINEDEIITTGNETLVKEELDINEETTVKKEKPKPKFQAGRKRIDLKAQRYIYDDEYEEDEEDKHEEEKSEDDEEEKNEDEEEENVDVETISESGNNPVLEAGDLKSLLEQFEATEVENHETSPKHVAQIENVSVEKEIKFSPIKVFPEVKIAASKNIKIKEEIEENKFHNKAASANTGRANPPDQKVAIEDQVYVTPNTKAQQSNAKAPSKSSVTKVSTSNNKQIIEALPQELINRIKESGKRKRVPIIDPVPNNNGSKKRKIQESSIQTQTTPTSVNNTLANNTTSKLQSIELDHNYCTVVGAPVKREMKKDSGYISAEEDDKTIYNQPIVKNADGKLMISLLKVNTIRSLSNEENKKKKLNIEEYKKRRLGVLTTPSSSHSNSPMSSTCSSPLPEDENTKRLKHEEKLRKMALELLNTPPKSCNTINKSPDASVQNSKLVLPVKTIAAPTSDMDCKTLVSIGVNTEISGRNPLSPAEKLEEIKPLLENASVKISSNSLITSLIENIPKVIKPDSNLKTENVPVHGENKTIIYLPKNRKAPQTSEIGVQTMISLLGNKRRYRRRKVSSSSEGSSSGSEGRSERSNSSRSSRYSKSSRSSRSTSSSSSSSRSSIISGSRSISRSPSPQRRRRRGLDQEYVQEVEERRVVYVGKIESKTTKQDLYRRFSRFGPIKTISLHFRDHGDNYGFVTFANKLDAWEAIEHGNDDPYDIQYDLSFGGRRLFCKTTYSDLDNMRDDSGYGTSTSSAKPAPGESFDRLLKEMQEKLKRRKV